MNLQNYTINFHFYIDRFLLHSGLHKYTFVDFFSFEMWDYKEVGG